MDLAIKLKIVLSCQVVYFTPVNMYQLATLLVKFYNLSIFDPFICS